jgi:hypothetical protein
MHAIFKGNGVENNWADPSAWANGAVPTSSVNLDIQLNANAFEDLGTEQHPFVAHNVVGATAGLTHPSLFMVGFLHAHDIKNLSDLQLPSGTGVTVDHDLVNVQTVEPHDGGFLDVNHDLVGVAHVNISFGSTVDVGHSVGKTSFVSGIGGGTLILDNPARHKLDNPIALGSGGSAFNIELGHVTFDAADFIPAIPGGLSGEIDLTEHGRIVYRFTNVSETAPAGILTVGFDKTTSYDVLAYHA